MFLGLASHQERGKSVFPSLPMEPINTCRVIWLENKCWLNPFNWRQTPDITPAETHPLIYPQRALKLRGRHWPEVGGSRPTVQSLSYSRWCLRDTSSACHTSRPAPLRSEPKPFPPSGGGAGTPTGHRKFQPPGYRLYREGSSGRDRHSTQPGRNTQC